MAARAEPIDWVGTDTSVTKTLPYTSARLRTLDKGDFKYGRIEVNAKIPAGQGVWPAIWMLPTEWKYGDWAASGEIDIMEAINLGTTDTTAIFGTLHYGAVQPGNRYTGTSYEFEDSDPTEQFHTYAIEWGATEIRWFVDDVHYATQRASGWYAQTKDDEGNLKNLQTGEPFDEAFHLLLNVAIGGAWPGSPDDTTQLPVEMEVDFVRVYTCPADPTSLNACATSSPDAERLFGSEPPIIIDVDYDPEFINQDVVVVFDDVVVGPFVQENYVASGTVDSSIVDDAERGAVTRIEYNTNESVAYFQSLAGFDYSEFSYLEFDVKVDADPRPSGGLAIKMDCFFPCGTGDFPIATPTAGEWEHYKIPLEDLVNFAGSSLDLTNVNTPLVIFPDWGNQEGVVLKVDNVTITK